MSYLNIITATALPQNHAAFSNLKAIFSYCIETVPLNSNQFERKLAIARVACEEALIANPEMSESTAKRWLKRSCDLVHTVREKYEDNIFIQKFLEYNDQSIKDICISALFDSFNIKSVEDAKKFVESGGINLNFSESRPKYTLKAEIDRKKLHAIAVERNRQNNLVNDKIKLQDQMIIFLLDQLNISNKGKNSAETQLVRFLKEDRLNMYENMTIDQCVLHLDQLAERIASS